MCVWRLFFVVCTPCSHSGKVRDSRTGDDDDDDDDAYVVFCTMQLCRLFWAAPLSDSVLLPSLLRVTSKIFFVCAHRLVTVAFE